ncbi:hypothetical protein [Christiangramia sabulilitoris]|uniref:Uncharacterized protein n=1 Tax=Christiangramia sabulilitoris TaxID=2583991 RepID=A0A550I7X0_9FLAO|nr:hypothetical protein [Christiangramia sabulilitoris]TRO67051.1 hypothetical protein FGM01_03965 [Christiangramia sabulilitoris]
MQLDLTEGQEQNLIALYTKQLKEKSELPEETSEIRKGIRDENSEQRREITEIDEENKSELRSILTEEQFTKWEGLQKKRRMGRPAPQKLKN